MPSNDAIAVLKRDHATVKQLFADYEELGARAEKARATTAQQICRELTVHAAIEEEVFYPRIRQAGKEVKDDVLEAVEEHAIIKQLVAEIERLSTTDEAFDAKVKVLGENVEHHVQEEEGEMFPRVRKAISEAELTDLGERMTAAREARLAAAGETR